MQPQHERFLDRDGISHFEAWWQPEQPPQAIILISHGYGEHIMRFAETAEYLVAQGFAVGGFDMRGHGQSAEQRGFIESYEAVSADLVDFIGRAEDRFPPIKRFLLSHSTGGAVVLQTLLSQPDIADGAILSSPAIRVANANPFDRWLTRTFTNIAPRFAPRPPDLGNLTHDEERLKTNQADPLSFDKQGIPMRTAHLLLNSTDYFLDHANAITTPLLIMHGSEDNLIDPNGSRQLYERVASTDKTLDIFEGMYHELHNETCRDEWMSKIAAWITDRL